METLLDLNAINAQMIAFARQWGESGLLNYYQRRVETGLFLNEDDHQLIHAAGS